ncbi:class I SAM-dependent methyltransferase [Marinicella rhabdoformis]|uniref:class I SAM-dependent methyltransferase n=1 Tax=Marinicella rhabdoformis TaxID=2580566 RepID=UPI0015CFCD9F|nr:class I SAM-dependent methyltransferase [Marinicella rhabdoformis]
MNTKNTEYLKALRFNWLTKHYDTIVSLTTREALFKKKLIEQSDLIDGDEVLDVGSGTGTLAIMLKQSNPNLMVTGVDGDAKIISLAQKKTNDKNIQISFKQGLSFDLPFSKSAFNSCFSSLFFHHLTDENKLKTFNEIFRVLKNGGQLHVADWGKPKNIFMRLLFYPIQFLDGFETTSSNIKGILPKLMEDSGFIEIKIEQEISTMFGTMTLYSAEKPISPAT